MSRPLRRDYDSDPERWRTTQRVLAAYGRRGDVHRLVAERLAAEGCRSVLDIGCGAGKLRGELRDPAGWVGCDLSPTMLSDAPRPAVRGDAAALPFRDHSFDAAAAMYMLYHLPDPVKAIGEAYRVLRPGGWFAAAAGSRHDAPELVPFVEAGSPQTFDAETAPEQIGGVFDEIEVRAWDTAAYELPDEEALRQYLRGWACHVTGDLSAIEYPFTITKRGAVVYAKKH